MLDSKSLPGIRNPNAPEAVRMLDWTSLDSAPTSLDVMRMTSFGGTKGAARFAILINTPRMLRAATVFAEQASLQGAQVRVFIDSKEAVSWLYKDVPPTFLGQEWPDSQPLTARSLEVSR